MLPIPLACVMFMATTSVCLAAGMDSGAPMASLPWAAITIVSSVASGVIAGQITVRVTLGRHDEKFAAIARDLKRHDDAIAAGVGGLSDLTAKVYSVEVKCAAQHGNAGGKVRT